MTKLIIEIREESRIPVINISGEQSFSCTQLEGDILNKLKIEITELINEKINSRDS